MSGEQSLALAGRMGVAALLVLLLSGCAYDYLQHSDRVAYSAGDAVKANLERETISSSKKSMYLTSGLGEDGPVVPASGEDIPPSD